MTAKSDQATVSRRRNASSAYSISAGADTKTVPSRRPGAATDVDGIHASLSSAGELAVLCGAGAPALRESSRVMVRRAATGDGATTDSEVVAPAMRSVPGGIQ